MWGFLPLPTMQNPMAPTLGDPVDLRYFAASQISSVAPGAEKGRVDGGVDAGRDEAGESVGQSTLR